VIKTAENMVTGIAEAMTGIDMMTAEAMTSIVNAMTNRDPMSELVDRRHRDTSDIKNDCPSRKAE